jgi:uncharacterized protein (DUF58 family)
VLTWRGFWFLFWSADIALIGVLVIARYAPTVPIFALTLLIWFVAEWIWFWVRASSAQSRISIERHILQGERELPTLWAGVDCTVRITIRLKGGPSLPFVSLADKLPVGQHIREGHRRTVTRLSVGEPVVLEYKIHPAAPGVVRFEGIELRTADLCGFFYRRLFFRAPTEYLVLPPLMDDDGTQRANKRFNTLPPPGVHRIRRAGSGTELLHLRDYLPGDPPKTIAWKASARKDKLITKELESDVPVRMILFLDASNSTRLGAAGKTPLAKLAGIGAGVLQAAAGNRDLIGLTVFDEREAKVQKPARTRLHTMQLLRTFAETAGRQAEDTETDPAVLQRHAHSLAQDLYPDLLEKRLNSRPFGLFWIPLLDSRLKWLLILPIAWQLFTWKAEGFNEVVELTRNIIRPKNISDLPGFLAVFGFLMFAPTVIAGVYWFLFGIRGFLPPRSRELSKRKQLSALFAARDGDSPASIERGINDDEFFGAKASRFLVEHHHQPPPKLFEKDGRYRFRCPEKIPILAAALVRSVGMARDNELYVVLADLVELTDDLEPLLKAVRAACGRHHQVLVLLPWPEDVPPPVDPREADEPLKRKKKRLSLGSVIQTSLVEGYHRKYDELRLRLVRAGASVVRVNQTDPVRLILARLDRIRGAGIRR